MTSGETLLKITDIPFSYTLLAIILGVMGAAFEGERIIILVGTAGALGTFLSVTDPVGRLLKFWLRRGLDKNLKNEKNKENKLRLDYAKLAVKTRAISYEMDKIVSISYLVIIFGVFSSAISNYPSFAEKLQLVGDGGNTICDTLCTQVLGDATAFIAMIFLAIVGARSWKELKSQAKTAGIHHLGISSEYVTSSTIENMSRAIEQNDWQTAKEWGSIVEKEIRIKKGKKDVIIQSVTDVYRPLYIENLQIETTSKEIIRTGNYQPIATAEWIRIKSTPEYLRIDETTRNKIVKFYNLIKQYNDLHVRILPIAQKMLREQAPNVFGEKIRAVRYWVKSSTGESAPDLAHLLLYGKHPLEQYDPETNPIPVRLELESEDGTRVTSLTTKNQFEIFNEWWKRITKEIYDDSTVRNTKEVFQKITERTDELKRIFLKNIQSQFDVE